MAKITIHNIGGAIQLHVEGYRSALGVEEDLLSALGLISPVADKEEIVEGCNQAVPIEV